jgi:hypothetical protein
MTGGEYVPRDDIVDDSKRCVRDDMERFYSGWW